MENMPTSANNYITTHGDPRVEQMQEAFQQVRAGAAQLAAAFRAWFLAAQWALIWLVASIRMQQAVGLVCAQHQRAWLAETAAFRAEARKRGWVQS